MKTAYFATAALTALCLSAPARADDSPPDVSELVVVATRTPQPLDHIGQQVTVIDAAALKAQQAVAISDALAHTPGVSFSRNGGIGGTTSLRIRGAETDQTVVIIDGVKLNDPSGTGGGYNFANLLAGDIARVEVLRGAQSTLWGSQAIGGVVNISTAQPTEAFEGSASVEGGSLNTGYARAAVGGKTERVVWRLAGGSYTTDGVSAYRRGSEKDGYHNTSLSGTAKVTLADSVYLDLRAVYSKGRNKFDGFPAPLYSFADSPEFGRTEEFVGYVGLNFDLLDGKLTNRVAYGRTNTDRDNFNPVQAVTPVTFDASGKNKRWEYQGTLSLPHDWQATFGLESERSSMRTASPSAFTPHPVPASAKVGIDSLYVQAIGQVAPDLTLTLGVRHDSHDTFGDHDLGQVAAAWRLNDGRTVLRASFGQGFKAPTLYQLFSQYGNSALAPEAANSWDAGIEHHFDVADAVVTATWFQRETRDQIDFVSCTAASTAPLCRPGGVSRFGYYDNIARAKAHGVELSAYLKLAGIDLDANYTWTDTENASPGAANRGKQLPRRPEQQANLTAGYTWANGFEVSGTVGYVGDAFDNVGNTYTLKAHTLADLRVSYPVTDHLEVYGRIENALDETYETTRNYGSPTQGVYVGVRAKF